jgi:hypothetical protein
VPVLFNYCRGCQGGQRFHTACHDDIVLAGIPATRTSPAGGWGRPQDVVGGADLGTRWRFHDKKKSMGGGGGSRRFARLFAAADVVLGCWERVRSFSDRFRVFFTHKSTPPPPFALPPPSRRAVPQHAAVRENIRIWELGGILDAFPLTAAC